MGVAGLLRAQHVGIRDLKNRLSEFLAGGKPLVATDRGRPKYFLIPYEEMAELAETLEELSDPRMVAQVQEARDAYRRGEGVPVSRLWKRLGLAGRGRGRR